MAQGAAPAPDAAAAPVLARGRGEQPPWAPAVWLAIAVVGLVGLASWWLFEAPPLSYQNVPMPVLDQPVRAGAVVRFGVLRCASKPLHYTVSRNLRNEETGSVRLLPSVTTDAGEGCTYVISGTNELPDDLAPGTYVLYGSASVPAVMRTHSVAWRTAPFRVTGAAESSP